MPKSNVRRVVPGDVPDMIPANESNTGAHPQVNIQGKVVHDPRGTAVYDWNVETGVFAAMDATDLLDILDNPGLALEGDTGPIPEWSGDPYNRR